MTFKDSALTVAEIQSSNYIENKTGWYLGRTGQAQFESLNAKALTAMRGSFSEDASIAGVSILDMIDALPKGVIGWSNETHRDNWGARAAGEVFGPLATMRVIIKAGRMYAFTYSGLTMLTGAAGQSAGIAFKFTTDGTTPNAGSYNLGSGIEMASYNKPGWGQDISVTGWFANGNNFDVIATVGIFGRMGDAASTQAIPYAEDGGTMFICEDKGRLNKMNLAQTSYYTPGIIAPPPKTRYDVTWWKQSQQSYTGSGARRGDAAGSANAYQGYYSGTNGNQLGMFFFDSANMRAQLAGATILNAYLYVDNAHFYNNAGGTMWIGQHNNDPSPASIVNTIERQLSYNLGYGGDIWTPDIGPDIGNRIRDGLTRGTLVGRAPDNNPAYYSYYNNAAIRLIFEK